VSQPSQEELQAYQQLQQQGYRIEYSPQQFYQLKSQGYFPYFETYEDYLAWVKSSPSLQPGAWTPPPKLPEKPTVEDVKKALEEAKSTEHVQAVIEQAKKAGITIEMSPAFYEEGVGRFVVAFGDVASGKIVETGFAFKGGGEQNILAKQTVEVDISKEIEKAQREGFQNLQLAIEKTFMACRPEDALKISLTGVKPPEPPPPPPEPPKDAFAVAKQLIETPLTPGKPVDTAALEFQQWFWKYAPQLAQRYGVKEEGPIGTPEAEEILRRMAEAGELKLEGDALKVEFKEVKEEVKGSPTAAAAQMYLLTGGGGPLASLVSQLTGVWRKIEEAASQPTLLGKTYAETGLFPAGERMTYEMLKRMPEEEMKKKVEEYHKTLEARGGELAAEYAAALATATATTLENIAEWKFVIGPATSKIASWGAQLHEKALIEGLKAEEAGSLAGMIKWRTIEAFTIPLRGLNWAIQALTPKQVVEKYEVPKELELVGEKVVWGRETLLSGKAVVKSWQEVSEEVAEALKSGEPIGFLPVEAEGKTLKIPFAQPGWSTEYVLGGAEREAGRLFGREWGSEFAFFKAGEAYAPKVEGGFFKMPAKLNVQKVLAMIEGGVPKIEAVELAGEKLRGPIFTSPSVPVKVDIEKVLAPVAFPVISPKLKAEREEKEELAPGLKVPIPVKVRVEEEPGEAFKLFTLPSPRLKVEEKPLETERLFPPLTLPVLSLKTERSQLELAPLQMLEQLRQPLQAPIQGIVPIPATPTMQTPKTVPEPPSAPAKPSEPKIPLPYFSPPASSVIYRAPEWRWAKYWRVDWFAKGLKLDLGLGKLARAFAPKPVKVKQVDWMKPRVKTKPKRKVARSKRKAGKRKSKKVKAV